ncbi:hypothetical protein [Micromonospora siamensis]|uniref:SUKH-4 immunity protein n=1 Tax=Micromonospora siamensis TaxID=299152 RepID=A0A1C5IPB8_9ACTN|nr:hypothetical protein [Micromonospora siamensis]SCG60164.1 hypothetical protein GA0074704_3655 [Micromonospora siamensis]
MSSHDQLLARLRTTPATADALAGFFEFDVTRDEPIEDVGVASGAALVPIAGDSTGGCYFLCGDGPCPPVVFMTSEGQGGLIADSLPEVLALIVGLPYWQDCLKFSAGGDLDQMRTAAARLEHDLLQDDSQVRQPRRQVYRELGLSATSPQELVARLHEAVVRTEPDFVLLDPDGNAYASLFNTFRVSDNPDWR